MKIAIFLEFLTFDVEKTRNVTRGHLKIAVLLQFLTFDVEKTRNAHRGTSKIAVLLQFCRTSDEHETPHRSRFVVVRRRHPGLREKKKEERERERQREREKEREKLREKFYDVRMLQTRAKPYLHLKEGAAVSWILGLTPRLV